ncbi:MAG TPA: hypothetical protein VFU31_24735 [Candidatus Binatia bacterium]|nr:hypothetical protein [Candidatus Binatia bacterium]
MKLIRGTIPDYVALQYGGRRAFKAEKRRALRAVMKALDRLYPGCAFFPCGNGPCERIRKELQVLAESIGEKGWSR